jgi:hypothetical protein
MSLTIFKSNKSNKGAMFSIKFAAKSSKKDEPFKPGGFFINIVKQVGWNEQSHTGKFSGGENISIKLDQFEAGKILHVLERNWNLGDIGGLSKEDLKQYSFYNMHSSQNQKVHINFEPWQRKDAKEQTGFALRITKVVGENTSTFGAAFSFGEDIVLREYIKLGLEHISMAGYAEDKRRFEEGVKASGNEEGEEDSAPASQKRSTGRTARPKATPAPAAPESQSAEPEDEEEPLF